MTSGALIIDTDVGGDPDDAIALAIAARAVPHLALVVTSDETDGERARFARYFLDLLGRPEVPVIAGADLGERRYFSIDDLVPQTIGAQPTDVVDAVAELCRRIDGPVRWVGMGPVSNLARVLSSQPDLAAQLVITQMGGAIQYRDPARAEHNFRLDPSAATTFIREARRPRLIISDVTFTPAIEITADSDLYRRLSEEKVTGWRTVLKSHLDRWFAAFYPGSFQHDPLTLSAALELPFVDFDFDSVTLDESGRMTRDPAGQSVFVSRAARYDAFLRWLDAQLDA
jgi:pyrimidine-specific ribonucleoside hydrolase